MPNGTPYSRVVIWLTLIVIQYRDSLMSKAQLPTNPLVTLRNQTDSTQLDYSRRLKVSKSVIACAESGMYHLIPVCYRNVIHDIRQVNKEYQEFRMLKRQFLNQPYDFPERVAERDPLTKIIEYMNLVPYAFADRVCITPGEVHKMTTVKRSITENLREAFEQIGLPGEWINEFDGALRYNGTARVRTTRA